MSQPPVVTIRPSLADLADAPGVQDLEALSGTGLIVQATDNDFVARTLVEPAAGIEIVNPAGIGGNPTLSLADDLAAVEGLSGTGLTARTAADTWTTRSIVAPAAGITVADGNGVSGNPTLALANDLAGVEALSGSGFAARTGADAWSVRTITAPAAGITISNGDGVSGNPTLALANDLAALEGLSTTGIIVRTGDGTATTRAVAGTTDRITVSNGDGVAGAPTLDIAATYVGQTSITTLGTIATGTWNATTIGVSKGGTGLTATPTNGQLPIGNGTGYTLATLTAGSGVSISNGGGSIEISATGTGGTVTSVGLSAPSIFSVSGSPVTTTGTLGLSLANQSANVVFAGPGSGGAAAPTFRALVADDIPSHDTSKLTSGTLGIARGGLGTGSTPSNGQLPIGNGSGYTLATLTAGTGISVSNGAGSITVSATASGAHLCQGRLTPSTGVAVPTSDVSSANTIYFTPYKGNLISLYEGGQWNTYTFTERSLSLSGASTTNPTDVGIYNNSGTLTLILYPWTNATTRATALTVQDGVEVISGATQVRYLGTLWCDAGPVVNFTQAKRGIWNRYNQVLFEMRSAESGSHTYNSASWREWNNATTNRLNYVVGLLENTVTAHVTAGVTASSQSPRIAIGWNSTTPVADGRFVVANSRGGGSAVGRRGSDVRLGTNYITPVQYVDTGTSTYDKLEFSASVLC